jgi:hypothetical protein
VPDYRLHYLSHEVELPVGEFAIGRGSKCQLIIDDPQVSRRHALLHVTAATVVIEDLGSRNATIVNGVIAKGRITLIGGDRIQIGRHEMILVRSKVDDTRDEVPTDGRAQAPWFHKSQLAAAAAVATEDVPAHQALDGREESTAPSSLLSDLAQKALSAGHVEEAEWILGKILAEFHYRASGGDPPPHAQLEVVIGSALRLAQLTGKTVFLDGLFDVLAAAGYVLDGNAVGELEALGRTIPALAKGRLGKYVASLHGRAGADGRLLARLEAICLPRV